MINPILILLLVMAWPRVFTVLSEPQRRRTPYYQIGRRAKWAMGVAYLVLAARTGRDVRAVQLRSGATVRQRLVWVNAECDARVRLPTSA